MPISLKPMKGERRLLNFTNCLEESPPQVTLELSEADVPERAAQKIREFLQFNTGLLQQCNDDRSALKFWRANRRSEGDSCLSNLRQLASLH